MTTEEKTKKNLDFSNSAVNLGEHVPVMNALQNWLEAQSESDRLRGLLEQTDLFQEWTRACTVAATAKAAVSEAVNLYGSYQDLDTGHYAIKQRKLSKQYHAEPFIENFEKYAPAVIEQTINTKALEGLVKGKLLTEDELKDKGVITTTESYAFIIK